MDAASGDGRQAEAYAYGSERETTEGDCPKFEDPLEHRGSTDSAGEFVLEIGQEWYSYTAIYCRHGYVPMVKLRNENRENSRTEPDPVRLYPLQPPQASLTARAETALQAINRVIESAATYFASAKEGAFSGALMQTAADEQTALRTLRKMKQQAPAAPPQKRRGPQEAADFEVGQTVSGGKPADDLLRVLHEVEFDLAYFSHCDTPAFTEALTSSTIPEDVQNAIRVLRDVGAEDPSFQVRVQPRVYPLASVRFRHLGTVEDAISAEKLQADAKAYGSDQQGTPDGDCPTFDDLLDEHLSDADTGEFEFDIGQEKRTYTAVYCQPGFVPMFKHPNANTADSRVDPDPIPLYPLQVTLKARGVDRVAAVLQAINRVVESVETYFSITTEGAFSNALNQVSPAESKAAGALKKMKPPSQAAQPQNDPQAIVRVLRDTAFELAYFSRSDPEAFAKASKDKSIPEDVQNAIRLLVEPRPPSTISVTSY